MTSYYRWNFDPKANASGKAGLSDVHLICACTDPRAKKLKFLPRALRKYSRKALKEVLLADVALKVSRKRDADIAAGLVPDGESNVDGGSVNINGDAGEVKEEGADGKPKSLVRMVLKGTDSDEEDSGSDADVRPSVDKPLLCKGVSVRSVHTVEEVIAIEKG